MSREGGAGGDSEVLARLAGAGVELSAAEWEALPEPARRRLRTHETDTSAARARLAVLAEWLRGEFPPGWGRPEGDR